MKEAEPQQECSIRLRACRRGQKFRLWPIGLQAGGLQGRCVTRRLRISCGRAAPGPVVDFHRQCFQGDAGAVMRPLF